MGKMNFEEIFGEDSHDYFETIIAKFGLEASYCVFQNEKDEIIIDEQWLSPKTKNVTANRLFKYDPDFIYLIKEDSQLDVLSKVLELFVQIEDYEQAATVRDIIGNLN
jgi:protein-arginine kinase activator protein McsA